MKLKLKTSFSQRDSQWSSYLLGNNTSTYTIGTDGCLITSITNYLNSVGYSDTPKTINDKGKANKCFVNGGWWVWSSLKNIYSNVGDAYISPRYDGVATPDSFFDLMRSKLNEGYALLVEVDFNPSQFGEQMHWVLAYGYDDATKEILISDPWTGSKVPLSVYGDPHECVYMFRHYQQKLAKEDDGTCAKKLEEAEKALAKANTELVKVKKELEVAKENEQLAKEATAKVIDKAKELDIRLTEMTRLRDAIELDFYGFKIDIDKKIEALNTTIESLSQDSLAKDIELDRLRKQRFSVPECINFLIIAIKGGDSNKSTPQA